MASPPRIEENIEHLIRKLHGYVDSLFETVGSLIDNRVTDVPDEVNERIVAVEELRGSIARETLLYIARWQPLGRDLTKAEGYIQAAYDLYRIARYLREIARLNMIAGPLGDLSINREALDRARRMVDTAVKSMLEGNVQLARSVEEEDKIIDSYYESSLRGLSEEVITRDKAIEALFARHVERIADHATYIAKLSSLT